MKIDCSRSSFSSQVHDSENGEQDIESEDQQPLVEANDKKSSLFNLIGCLLLVFSIIGGSSIGAIANFIPVETSFAKNAWRAGFVSTIFLVPTVVEYLLLRKKKDYGSIMSLKQYLFICGTLLCQVIWTFGLIYASLNTIQSQAYVFNNIHGIFIVLIYAVTGQPPRKKEMIGVALAIIGCGFMIMDPQAARLDSPGSSVLPALVDIGSAFFGALYFIFSAANCKNVPMCLLLLIYNSHIFILNSAIAKAQNHDVQFFSTDVHTGCFGFLNWKDQNALTLSMYGIFCSFFGSAGYVLTLLFFSPLVTSNAYLIEPFIAQVLGYSLNLDQMPGIMTLIGTISALAGILFIAKGDKERQSQSSLADSNNTVQLTQNQMLIDIYADKQPKKQPEQESSWFVNPHYEWFYTNNYDTNSGSDTPDLDAQSESPQLSTELNQVQGFTLQDCA